MKRIFAIALCAAMTVATLAGCTPKAPYVPTGNGLYQDTTPPPATTPSNTEQTLTLGYDPDRSMNPYTATDLSNRVLLSLLYQPLFAVDPGYNAVPILCKRYAVSRDLCTYTFYIEEATFSNGTALTAQDVAASLTAAMENPVYQGRFTQVADIAITEDGAVSVTLRTPYENFPLLLDVPIVPADQVNYAHPLGTGPYVLEEHTAGHRLVRRSDWWCRASLPVSAASIPLVKTQSTTALRDSFEFGSVGLVCADPGSDTYVDYRCDYELWDCENGIFLYLACNEKSKVFSNTAIRKALTHAIDRNLLVSTYYRDFASAATLPASPDFPYYDKTLAAQYGYDAEVFAQAVADAQLSTTAVTLLVNKEDSHRVRVAKAIAQMLTDCGLTVTVSILGGTDYTNALTKGNFDLHLGQTKLSANMDLSAFFDTKGSLNFGSLSDAATFGLCQEALANSGNYYTLHQRVMEDGMLCPILFRSYAIYTQRGSFAALSPARDNLFFYSLGKTLEQIRTEA